MARVSAETCARNFVSNPPSRLHDHGCRIPSFSDCGGLWRCDLAEQRYGCSCEHECGASIAIFNDDLIETGKSAVARIESAGSSADINPETMVQYHGDELVLDHGSVSVNTSRGMRVRVGCVTITPVNPAEWTQYQVVDLDGKITVMALKLDVYIDARSNHSQEAKKSSQSSRDLVREGEQKSRSEKCGAAYIKPERAGIVSIMNSTYAKWTALAAVGVIACFGLCHDDDPISGWKP